jgi:lipopolysaccharide transport protein LptA
MKRLLLTLTHPVGTNCWSSTPDASASCKDAPQRVPTRGVQRGRELLIGCLLPCILFVAAHAHAQQPAKPLSAQDKWVITGKGASEFLASQRKAVFRDNVHLDARPEMELNCQLMTAFMGATNRFERIEAERDLVIKIYETKDGQMKTRLATAERGVYVAATDTVTLTGNARLEVEEGVLTARIIHYNRTTGDVRTEGDYKMESKPRPAAEQKDR